MPRPNAHGYGCGDRPPAAYKEPNQKCRDENEPGHGLTVDSRRQRGNRRTSRSRWSESRLAWASDQECPLTGCAGQPARLRNDSCTRGSATRPEWRAAGSSSRCFRPPARPRRAHSSALWRRRSARRVGECRSRLASTSHRPPQGDRRRWPKRSGWFSLATSARFPTRKASTSTRKRTLRCRSLACAGVQECPPRKLIREVPCTRRATNVEACRSGAVPE
jgi:hypothetical protein